MNSPDEPLNEECGANLMGDGGECAGLVGLDGRCYNVEAHAPPEHNEEYCIVPDCQICPDGKRDVSRVARTYLAAPENSAEEETARTLLGMVAERLGFDVDKLALGLVDNPHAERAPTPRCEKCQAYEHEADECPHGDGTDAIDEPDPERAGQDAYLRDLTPAELSTNGDGAVARLAPSRIRSEIERVAGLRPGALTDAPDTLEPCAYRRLHDGLSDMIESGRLTAVDIPDDYAWLVSSLVGLSSAPATLEPGMYSAFVLHENGTWEQPTYRVPAGWTESELGRAILAEHGRKAFRVDGICPDPDCPEDVARDLPQLEVEPDAPAADAPEVPFDSPAEVMRVAILSTGNLSADEGQRCADAWPTHCHRSEYGFIVYVGTGIGAGDDPDEDTLSECDAEDWPGFLAAAAWARKFGIEWVRFDCDGPEQPGLPTWEW